MSGGKQRVTARRLVLTLGLFAYAAGSAVAEEEYTLKHYGDVCEKLIAKAPVFNCLDLDIVPITVNGKEPETYTKDMTCDRPAMLPYPETTDGQCAPYSRMSTVRDDDVQILQLCRRMYIRPIDDPQFDSIEMIMHNVKTGSTCFFISKNFGTDPAGENGIRVPPPNETDTPEGFVKPDDLWGTPQHIANEGCIYCHDSDPWMHTPWSAQNGQLPADPHGFHSADAGGPFDAWPKPHSISTRGNTCTGCHRIGSLNTCQDMEIPTFGDQPAKMMQSIGQAPHGRFGARPGTIYESPPEPYSDWASTYPHSYWMPLSNWIPFTEWERIYQDDVKALQRCCQTPDAPECIIEPIQSLQDWLEANKAADAAVE